MAGNNKGRGIPSKGTFARIRFNAVNKLLEGTDEILRGELVKRLVVEDLVEGIVGPLFIFFRHRGMPLKRAMRYKTLQRDIVLTR